MTQGDLKRDRQPRRHTKNQTRIPNKRDDLDVVNVDYVASDAKYSHSEAMLYIFDDDEAVIKMIVKGRGPTIRHTSRTHRSSAGIGCLPGTILTSNPN